MHGLVPTEPTRRRLGQPAGMVVPSSLWRDTIDCLQIGRARFARRRPAAPPYQRPGAEAGMGSTRSQKSRTAAFVMRSEFQITKVGLSGAVESRCVVDCSGVASTTYIYTVAWHFLSLQHVLDGPVEADALQLGVVPQKRVQGCHICGSVAAP